MNVTGLWTKLGNELADEPLLVMALLAALIALATTPLAFAVLGRMDWFKAGRGRVMQRPEFASIVAAMVLVMGIPAIFAALVLKSRSFDKNRYEFDPNRTWSVLEQGRGFQSVEEADAAVKAEMERLATGAEEPGRHRQEARRGDARTAGRRGNLGSGGAGAFRPCLQSLAGVRKSVGVDGPQQLHGLHRAAGRAALARPHRQRGRADVMARRSPRPRSPPASRPAPAGRSGLGPARGRGRDGPPSPSLRRRSPPCCRLRTCRRAGRWASRARNTSRRSTPRTSTRRSTAAPRASSSTTSRGWPTPTTTPTGDASNEIQLYIFEMADALKALGKYGSEKPDEAKPVAIGDRGLHRGGQHALLRGEILHPDRLDPG